MTESRDEPGRCDACKAAMAEGSEALLVPYRKIAVQGETVTFTDCERLLCLNCAGATLPDPPRRHLDS